VRVRPCVVSRDGRTDDKLVEDENAMTEAGHGRLLPFPSLSEIVSGRVPLPFFLSVYLFKLLSSR
jgi:hypothetical protein